MKTSILRLPPLTLDAAQQLAAHNARTTHMPWHVAIDDHGDYVVCDDADVRTWRLERVVYSVEPEAVYLQVAVCFTCGGDGDCPDCEVSV